MLNIALPKGRLGAAVHRLFEAAGYGCGEIEADNRKLVFENPVNDVRCFLVKPSDVAVFVERGAADIGAVGKDILIENSPDVYELLDLKLGKCRMAVAAKSDFREDTGRPLRVATKFVHIANDYYASRNRDVEITKLSGSVELAPILGISDVIVDIVETGATLRENDLKVLTEFMEISARLIANKTSFKFKQNVIQDIARKISAQIS